MTNDIRIITKQDNDKDLPASSNCDIDSSFDGALISRDNADADKLDEFKKIDSDIQFSVKTLQAKISIIDDQVKKWSETAKDLSNVLNGKIDNLLKETNIFTLLPEKIDNRLQQSVPNISKELGQQILNDFASKLAQLDKQLDLLMAKHQVMAAKIEQSAAQNFRKKLVSIAGIVTLSVIISSFSAWFLVQKLPKFVTISGSGDITIQGGDVSIWGSAKSQIQQRGEGKKGK